MTLFLHDLRIGLRAFARTPGFTAAAVLTLAIGIGATTTIFSFVNAIVLQPLPFPDSERLRELLAYSVSTPRFRGIILTTFALSALVLVMTGIVGMLTYTVARRTREIGLRMALGARPSQVLRLIVRQALTMTVAGLLVGIVAAAALARTLTSYLFDVAPAEPAVFAAAALIVIALAAGAAYLPARRAAHVDPLLALRSE